MFEFKQKILTGLVSVWNSADLIPYIFKYSPIKDGTYWIFWMKFWVLFDLIPSSTRLI